MPAAAAARRYGVSDRTAAPRSPDTPTSSSLTWAKTRNQSRRPGSTSSAAVSPAPRAGDGQARSEWFTHLVDLGTGGTLGLARERTGEAGKGLLKDHESTLRYLAMDLSAPYRSAVPAGVTVIADAFHLVKLANRKIGDAFRRLSYRTEHAHEDLGLPRPLHYMLRHNIETLDPGHLAIDHRDPGRGRRRPADRRGLDRQGAAALPCSPSASPKRTSARPPARYGTGSPPSTCGARTTSTSPS